MRRTSFTLGAALGLALLGSEPAVARAQTAVRPLFLLAVDNSNSMSTSTGSGTNTCGYTRTRINDVGCVIRNAVDALGEPTYGLATFNFSCRAALPHYPNGVSGCGTGTCPSAGAPVAPAAFPSLPYPSFYGCANGSRLLVPLEERRRYELRSWVDGLWTGCGVVPPPGELGGEELCMVPTSSSGALRGSTPNASLLRVAYDYLANRIPGRPSPYVDFDGSGRPDPYAACRPVNIILLTDGNETCAGLYGAPLNAANLGCLQVDLNGNGVFEDPIPDTDPEPLLRGLYERNRDLNGDGDCYDAGEQRAFRIRTYAVQFEGTIGTACACDTAIELIGRYGGVPPHTVGCSTAACSGLTAGQRYGYYARSESEFAAVLSQIVADSVFVESCNGMDDDCDRAIDETFAVGETCTEGVGACARTGTRVCSPDGLSTVCSVSAGPPAPESDDTACANGADDDCDGLVDCADDDCVTTSACTARCVPGVEVCNGADDDCDGRVDEGGIARPCGSAVGACRPGVEVCLEQPAPGSGAAMYGPCSGTMPSPEECNGIDDDCDGAIDDGVPVGATCGVAEGVCMPGVERCIGGRWVCTGATPARREACNCLDDDCDGRVDESADGTICPGASECIACQCAVPCVETEFGDRCPTGRTPDRSTGRCLCLLPLCDAAECAARTIERAGEVVCAPGRDDVGPCVCRGAECVPACDGIRCDPGTRCDPFDPAGRCRAAGCEEEGCPEGRHCDRATGMCVDERCVGVRCEVGTVCRDGTCVPIGAPDAGRGGSFDGGPRRVLAAGGGGCACRAGASSPRGGLAALLILGLVGSAAVRRRRRAAAPIALPAAVLTAGAIALGSGCAVDPYCLECEADGGRDSAVATDARDDAVRPCIPGSDEECNDRDDDCDGAIDEGFDRTRDVEHCGGCGRRCAPPGAFGVCEGGVCRLGECDVGFVDLDGREDNGCEYACLRVDEVDAICDGRDDDCDGAVDENVDLTRDPAHCGSCGQVCSYPHAVGNCEAGRCRIAACDAGFVDLDGDPANGCEYACDGAAGATEACNGVDEDCDGRLDEGVTPPEGLCRTLGACAGAVPECRGALGFRCRYGAGVEVDPATGQPVARETLCDGIDGNCNGAIDEAFHGLGAACTGGGVGACRTTGRIVCRADARGTECDAPAPPPPGVEICNGIDDDCDGLTDELRAAPGDSPSFVSLPWVEIAPRLFMLRYEASRPDATARRAGTIESHVCSREGVLPWTNLRHADAAAACASIGARLCTEAEWESACRGASGTCTYAWQTPSCTAYSMSACNTADRADPDVVLPTGSLPMCHALTAGGEVFDLSGNVKEFLAPRTDGSLPVRGGSYNQIGFGARCDLNWQVVEPSFRLESVGFRCCFSGATPP
jgi:hypothetical protein